jgi:hypothetical protein
MDTDSSKNSPPRRVAFIAHALLPDYVSSRLIDERLDQLRRPQLGDGDGEGMIHWWDTEFAPRGVLGASPVHLDFDIIPTYAPKILQMLKADADAGYRMAADVAEIEMDGALGGGPPIWIGWGALTKNLTAHGKRFLDRHPPLDPFMVSTNHGDAGTTALTLMALERLGVKLGKTIAIMGASGVIGSALARTLGDLFSPSRIVLVGRNAEELARLKEEIRSSAKEVVVDTAYHQAANTYGADVVLVATTGQTYEPEHFPDGCVILDVCTPAACDPAKAWGNRMVFAAGCGVIPALFLPKGLATMNGRQVDDVGAGGKNPAPNVLWGCTCECIAQASFGVHEHVVGTITREQVLRARSWFDQLGIEPQPPVIGVRTWRWDELLKAQHCVTALW